MKKKSFMLPLLLCSLMVGTSLVACGNKTTGSTTGSQTSQAQKAITVTAADSKTTLLLGETVQLTASEEGVTWSVAKEGVVTVSATGLVTSVGEGSVQVKASKEGFKDGSITIKVNLVPIEIVAEGGKTSLLVGETVQLTADKEGVTWESSDASIATVNDAGLVTAVKFGEATITAKKAGFANGTKKISVVRPPVTATLHFEDATHYSADGWWSSASYGSERGPGATPIYAKDSASDGTCVAYFDVGDKETLKFTSNKAGKAELVVTMGYSSSFEDLSTVETVKFNGTAVNMAGVSYTTDGEMGVYSFTGVSLGEVNLVNGDNTLEFEFLASAPYLDDLQIYAATGTTIAVVAAPAMTPVAVTTESITVEETGTAQIACTTEGVEYVSGSDTVATVSATGLVTGVAAGSTTVTVKKAGMQSVRIPVTVTEKVIEGAIKVEAETGTGEGIDFRTPSANSKASGDITQNFPVGATLTIEFQATAAGKYTLVMCARGGTPEGGYTYSDVNLASDVEIKLNGAKLTLEGTVSGGTLTKYTLGEVDLVQGKNTITVTATVVAPTLDYFMFTPKA